jgi:enamine deaminase RidA (YjgF/YER057c/UK114 family)
MINTENALATKIKRWSGAARGRSRAVAYGDLVWTVATATDLTADFEGQVAQSLQILEAHLTMAGSARTHLLSVQVMLTDIALWSAFDTLWQEWIGPTQNIGPSGPASRQHLPRGCSLS